MVNDGQEMDEPAGTQQRRNYGHGRRPWNQGSRGAGQSYNRSGRATNGENTEQIHHVQEDEIETEAQHGSETLNNICNKPVDGYPVDIRRCELTFQQVVSSEKSY